jgi:hypothetical protein
MTERRRAVIQPPDRSHTAPTLGTPSPYVPERIAGVSISLPGGADDNDKPMQFAFGLVETEGSIRFAFQNGNDLWVVRALALGEREATIYGGEQAGECDGLVGIFTDSGPFTSPNFTSTFYSGALTQTAHAPLAAVIAAAGGSWTETLVITDKTGKRRGICHAIECWQNVSLAWGFGIPKIKYRFRGSRMLNTTTGLVQYTVTPVWQARFWALDPSGGRMRPSRINEPSFQAAAAATPSTQYESHMLLSANTRECRKMFALLWDGWLPYAAGNQLTAIADRNTAPVASYDDSHFAAGVEVEAGQVADPDQMVNSVTIEYTDTTDPFGVWKTKSLTLRTAGLIAGTETEVPVTYKFPQIHNPAIVNLKLGYLLYSYQAYRIKGKWLANAGGPRLIGDVVTQSVPARGIVDNFRIMARGKPSNGTYDVELELIDARKWAGAASTAPAKVGSTLQDPYAPDPPTGLVLTPLVDQPQPGIFAAKLRVAFTPAISSYYAGTRAVYSINGGPSIEMPVVSVGPIEIPVPAGIAAVVAVSLYTVSITRALSAALSGSATMFNPNAPEAPGDIYSGANGIYCDPPPVRSYATYAGWSHSGMSSVTLARIQDGDTALAAATWGGAGSGLIVDAGAAINPHEFFIHHSSLTCGDQLAGGDDPFNGEIKSVEVCYSDTGTSGPWTVDGQSSGTADSDFKALVLMVRRFSSAAHRYWFIRNTGLPVSGVVTEVKIATRTGATYPYVSAIKVTGYTPLVKTDNFKTTPPLTREIGVMPTAAAGLPFNDFKYRAIVGDGSVSGGVASTTTRARIEIRVVSPTGAVSLAQTLFLGTSIALPTGSPGTQPYQPLQRANFTGAGAWVNATIFGNVSAIYADTAAGDWKLNSLADAGTVGLYEGRVVDVINTGSGSLWIASAGSAIGGAPAGSTVSFPTGWPASFSLGPGNRISLRYDATAAVWRVLIHTSLPGTFGIGTSAPAASLEVAGSGAKFSGALATETHADANVWVGVFAGTPRVILGGTTTHEIDNFSGTFRILRPGAVSMSIDSSGNATFPGAVATNDLQVTNPIKEQGRAIGMGVWVDVAYNGSNFTGGGGGSWIVHTGDVLALWYFLVGKVLTVGFDIVGTTTVAPTFVQFVMPGGFTAARNAKVPIAWFDGTSWARGHAAVAASGTVIKLFTEPETTFPSVTNDARFRGQIAIPI